MKVNKNENKLLNNLDIIKEVAISAVTAHCKECGCYGCQLYSDDNCCNNLQTYFADQIIVALSIEIVKEKANESKD